MNNKTIKERKEKKRKTQEKKVKYNIQQLLNINKCVSSRNQLLHIPKMHAYKRDGEKINQESMESLYLIRI